MSNYLVHHGILGQKWGKKNGPPYPLNYNDLSTEERAKAKESAIRRGDIKEAHANRDHYTDQELKAVMDRFDVNQKLSSLNAKQLETTAKKVKKICDAMGDIKTYGEKAIGGYNTIAKIANSLAGTDMPMIDGKKDKSNQNNDGNGNNNNNNNNGNNNNKKPKVEISKDYTDGELTKQTVKKTKNGKTITKNNTYTKYAKK